MFRSMICASVFLPSLMAGVQAVPNLRELTSQAEVIVLGTLLASSSEKLADPSPGQALFKITADLQLVRTIVGALAPGDQVAVRWLSVNYLSKLMGCQPDASCDCPGSGTGALEPDPPTRVESRVSLIGLP